MCDCGCGCKNQGLRSLDGFCRNCDLGIHLPKKKKAVISTKKSTPLCFDCGQYTTIITSRYRPNKGKKIYWCSRCRHSMGRVT